MKMDASSSAKKCESTNDEGKLVLYYFPTSSYSQKVYFALCEKKLKFDTKLVDLFNGEQLEPSYLVLNPKGEVPVLKDGVKIIPDSSRILDYLEDNFSNGDTPRLKPEKGSTQYQLMEKFDALLNKISIPVITFGTLLHTELTDKVHMSAEEVKERVGLFEKGQTRIDNFAQKHKDFKDQYAYKEDKMKKLHSAVKDIKYVKKEIEELEKVFDEVEKELASHEGEKEKWWLCGEKFTIADITLAVILNRLHSIGLWKQCFDNSKHPKLLSYYKRVKQRDAFKRTMNQGLLGFCEFGMKKKAISLGVAALLVLGIAGVTAFLVRRVTRIRPGSSGFV